MHIECPVCRSSLHNPTTLTCGHSQCAAHRQPCPICRCPNNPVSPPPTDVVLASILANPKSLQEELTCHICYQLFHEPVTAPCQHTFCSKCLQRSLDHSRACPVCRAPLPASFFHALDALPINRAILSVVLNAFPAIYKQRAQAIENEHRLARLNTPIFVCQLSFPGVPTILHFFEPRYRLMLRRCLQNPSPCFGMVMAPKSGTTQSDYGTILDIKNVQTLPDGRSVVETCGSSRFRILERATLDGYMVARIEPCVSALISPSHRPPLTLLSPPSESTTSQKNSTPSPASPLHPPRPFPTQQTKTSSTPANPSSTASNAVPLPG